MKGTIHKVVPMKLCLDLWFHSITSAALILWGLYMIYFLISIDATHYLVAGVLTVICGIIVGKPVINEFFDTKDLKED